MSLVVFECCGCYVNKANSQPSKQGHCVYLPLEQPMSSQHKQPLHHRSVAAEQAANKTQPALVIMTTTRHHQHVWPRQGFATLPATEMQPTEQGLGRLSLQHSSQHRTCDLSISKYSSRGGILPLVDVKLDDRRVVGFFVRRPLFSLLGMFVFGQDISLRQTFIGRR